MNGNYATVLNNVSDIDKVKMLELPYIERVGKISVIGTVNVVGTNYTVGCFEDKTSEVDYHLPLIEGELPTKSGEIAIPKFLLNQMYADISLGDEINIELLDLNGKKHKLSFQLSGIISNFTNRYDMEYSGFNSTEIVNNEIPYPNPSIYINKYDAINFSKYYNYLVSPNETTMINEGTEKFDKSLNEILPFVSNVSPGLMSLNLMNMTNNSGTVVQGLTATETDNIKIIHIITFFMMIVAAIAMFSGVISIMPQRIESLQLLRSIGMSKRRLFGMFITEFFLFWLIGNIIGIALGCGVHEIVILFRKLIGISAYRGYRVEFIIGEITVSPFILPLVLSLLIALVSLIVPIYKILKMSFYQKAAVKKSKKNASNLYKAFSKITSTVLSCISIVVVIVISSFGYCYYTNIGKGKTFLTIGNENASGNYYKVQNINMKENDFDCAVISNIPSGNSIAVYDKEYGITADKIFKISEISDVFAWNVYPAYTVIYGENDEKNLKLGQNIVPFNEEWEHYNEFKTNTIYDIQLILINDKMMSTLGGYSSDDVVILSKSANFPFDIEETVHMFTCLCDDGTHALLDTSKKIDVKVTQQCNISELQEYDIDLLKNCNALKYTGEYAFAMTAQKAEELGFYHAEYSTAFMKFNSELTDEEMRQTITEIINKPVQITTIYELKHNAILNVLSSNVNVFVLFVLLFILCIVSIINLIHTNVQNNLETFHTLHAIGLPKNKIQRLFVTKIMKNTITAIIIGIATTLAGKGLLIAKFNEYITLLEKQQVLAGNTAYPKMIFFLTLSEVNENDTELYSLTERINNIHDKFFLDKEMWSPNLIIPLSVICGIILLTTLMCSIISAKKIKDERSSNND